MEFMLSVSIFAFFFGIFLLYNSYVFQIFYRARIQRRRFLDDFEARVNGVYFTQGFYSTSTEIIFPREFNRLSSKQKSNLTHCYNVIKFKTDYCDWEIFFYLVKEGMIYKEYLNLRGFPRNVRLHSESNVENNKNRINTMSNNRYLAAIMEEYQVQKKLGIMLDENGDVFQIFHNNFHFNVCINSKNIGVERMFEIFRCVDFIKNKVYKNGTISY